MAESFDKFWISIDADVSVLQSELIKAQNQLRQFQTTLKKSTDVGAITALNTNITFLENKIAHLNSRIGETPKSMGDATNALTNFSRIAQDAPYGMIGITNNLNPMLESFQRLAATEGGTKKALQAMAAGLTGPAGIGIGLAVVSSLIVAFGDDIGLFIDKATGGSASLREFANSFKGAKTAFSDAYIQIENVNSAFEKFRNGTLSKKDALDEYNNSLGKVYGTTKDIAEAEKLFIDNQDNYVKAALYRAAAQIALKKASEEAFKQLQAQNAPQNANKGSLFMGEGLGAFALSKVTGGPSITATDIIGSQAIAKKAKEQEGVFKSIFKVFQDLANEQDKLATHSKTFGQEIDKSDPFKEYSERLKFDLQNTLNDMEKYRNAFEKLNLKPILTVFNPEQDKLDEKRKQYFEKKNKELLDETKKSGGLGDFLQKDARQRADNYAIEDKKLKQLNDSYENFANMLASDVTNGLMNVFTAFEEGKNPLESIGQMFINIAKNIAAAVIQATIFSALLNAFPELKAIFKASSILTSAFGYSGPRATGGITNGPSMALVGEAGPEAIIPLSKLGSFLNTSFNAGVMSGGNSANNGQFVLKGNDLVLALQRSNSSLNLRRGGI
jgi:hypothetical protein